MATRKQLRSGRKTRKGGLLSVASLHGAFEKLDGKIRHAIQKGATETHLAATLRKEWSKLFHQPLSTAAVKGMASHYRALYGNRKTRKQRGGMAPMDWTMGQGVTSAVYGRFPTEIAQSSGALDRFYENPVSRSCDSTGGHSASQKGGGLFDAFMAGHAPASVPRNAVEVGVSAAQGAPYGNPPRAPEVATWSPASAELTPFSPSSVSQITTLASIAT